MGTFRVVKTSDGGYWVSNNPAEAEMAGVASAVASGVGSVIGEGLAALLQYSMSRDARRRAKELGQGVDEIQRASTAGDWGRVYLVGTDLVRRHPDQSTGYAALAWAACYLGRPDEALRVTEQAPDPGTAEREELACIRLYAYMLKENVAAIIREVRPLMSSEDSDVRQAALLARTRAMLWLGDLDQALRDAGAAVTDDPNEVTYGLRGDVRWARKELSEALADYTFALRLTPDDADLHDKRAAVHEALGNTTNASEDAASARRLGSTSAQATAGVVATVTVRRVHHQKKDLGGPFKLWVDDAERTSLPDGGTEELHLAAGPHVLQLHWGPRKSDPLHLSVRQGEHVLLECGLVPGRLGMLGLVLREAGSGGKPFCP